MTKKERVLAVFHNKKVDYVPAGFWFHYNADDTVQETIDEHLKLYRETGMDLIKIMQDYMYPVEGNITCADDWYHISVKDTSSEEFKKMSDVIHGIRKEAGNDVLIFQTMYGPTKAASIAFGDDVLMKYAKESPKAVKAGLEILAEGLQKWARAFLEDGADGIYYSAQFSENGRFTKEQWEDLVKPFDLMILNVADTMSDRYNILHICGEPEYEFHTSIDWFTDYPADIVNWSVKDNGYPLKKGCAVFQKAILGGMDNKGNIAKGPKESIADEVHGILDAFGSLGIMIGADCTVQGENIRLDYIKTAVDAAHNYKK